jgi:hypothetical protein
VAACRSPKAPLLADLFPVGSQMQFLDRWGSTRPNRRRNMAVQTDPHDLDDLPTGMGYRPITPATSAG